MHRDSMRDMASRYHHGNLREALIDAAASMIMDVGVHGLSLRGVARKAGVSQAAPYHHFKDKEALLAEICSLGFQRLTAAMRASVQDVSDPVDKLMALGHTYIEFALDNRPFFRVMFGGHVHKDCHTGLQEESHGAFEVLLEVVAEGQAKGVFQPDPLGPIPGSLACWAGVHGAASLSVETSIDETKLAEHGLDLRDYRQLVLTRLVRGLAVDPASS